MGQDGCADPDSSSFDWPCLKAFLQHFSIRSQLGRWSQRKENFLVKMCCSQKCWSWVVSPFPGVSKYHSTMLPTSLLLYHCTFLKSISAFRLSASTWTWNLTAGTGV